MNNSENSKILLICIGLNPNIGYPQEVSINDLFLIFHIFGKINSIVIFSQKSPVKAFVEFSLIEEANKVKESLHDMHLNAFGKVRIFPSPLKQLETSNKFLEVKDFKDIDQDEYLKTLLSQLGGEIKKANIFEQSFSKKNLTFKNDEGSENIFLEEKLGKASGTNLQEVEKSIFTRKNQVISN